MSGIVGKKNSTLKKESIKENKLLATGVKAIKFWHEASVGETSIPFGSLVMPADVAVNGFSNPTSTEILAANLALFHTNVEVHSSLNQKLMEGLTYVVKNSQVSFLNGYTSQEGEVFVVVYKNDTITGTNVVDARPLTATGTLTLETTDFNVGEVFKTNAYPNDQMGEVMVFLDGEIQYRNTANAVAGITADGNYQEVHATNGFGTIIRFNETFPDDKPVIVLSRNLIAERPDISMMQLIEVLGGQLDSVLETVAALAGVDISEFRVAPNQVDLKAFAAQVTANTKKLADTTTVEVPIVTQWASYVPVFTGFGTVTEIEFEWRQNGQNIEINGKWRNGTVTASAATFSLPPSQVTFSYPTFRLVGVDYNENTSPDNNMVVASPNVAYLNPVRAGFTASDVGSVFNSNERHSVLVSVRIKDLQTTQTLTVLNNL